MADRIVERLKGNGFRFDYDHIRYAEVGHAVFGAPTNPAGTVEERARFDSFSRSIAFLERHFRN